MLRQLKQKSIDDISTAVRCIDSHRYRSRECALFMSSVLVLAIATISACSMDVACDGGVCLSDGQSDIIDEEDSARICNESNNQTEEEGTCADSAPRTIPDDYRRIDLDSGVTLSDNLPSNDVDWHRVKIPILAGPIYPKVSPVKLSGKNTRVCLMWNHQELNHVDSYHTTCATRHVMTDAEQCIDGKGYHVSFCCDEGTAPEVLTFFRPEKKVRIKAEDAMKLCEDDKGVDCQDDGYDIFISVENIESVSDPDKGQHSDESNSCNPYEFTVELLNVKPSDY